jgi:hypothetical protein
MLHRREMLTGALGAMLSALIPRRVRALTMPLGADADGAWPAAPLRPAPIGPSIAIGGFPFAPGFTGDPYVNPHGRFPDPKAWLRDGRPPRPTETADVVVVGGGLSGLATAYLLRERRPIVFESNPRFGGSSIGEQWGGVDYSLGGAYVITPDRNSFLQSFYRELGLDAVARVDQGDFEIELNAQIIREIFWIGGLPGQVDDAFQRYADVVTFMANQSYPDIPLPEGKDVQWILDLDERSLLADLVERMGVRELPPLLAAALQAYCYSSFGAGAEEISAASGWNFLAAEEFGRWVFPGGNAQITMRLFRALAALEDPGHARRLRAGSLVVEVRLLPEGVQVTWVDPTGQVRSLLARRVVMCCPKNVCRRVLHDLGAIDAGKLDAMHQIGHAGYVVANVLIDAPIERDFYDVFLLGDGRFPLSEAEAMAQSRVIDVLNGHYALGPKPPPRSVLTLYWPLPWTFGQHTLLNGEGSWRAYARRLAEQLPSILSLLDAAPEQVRQVRMTYFGHAMPIARPGFIASGAAAAVRRPLEGRVFFVEQDNWALPAVENCLLDAAHFAPQVLEGI